MEPCGCSVANNGHRPDAETAKQARSVAADCHLLLKALHGKEWSTVGVPQRLCKRPGVFSVNSIAQLPTFAGMEPVMSVKVVPDRVGVRN